MEYKPKTKNFFLAVKRRVAMKAIENKRKLKENSAVYNL